VTTTSSFEGLLHDLAPRVLGTLVRRYQQFDTSEDAGETAAAREVYQLAARMTASVPEQRYLLLRAAALSEV